MVDGIGRSGGANDGWPCPVISDGACATGEDAGLEASCYMPIADFVEPRNKGTIFRDAREDAKGLQENLSGCAVFSPASTLPGRFLPMRHS